MVAVLGISDSSKAGLVAELNELGTNLLTVSPGPDVPRRQRGAARSRRSRRAPPAERSLGRRRHERVGASVRRSPFIEAAETGGMTVEAAEPAAARDARRARCVQGRFLDARQRALPVGRAGYGRRAAARGPAARGRRPAGPGLYRRPLVHGRGDHRTAAARARNRTGGADRIPDRRTAVRHDPPRQHAVRARRPRTGHAKRTRFSVPRRTRRTRNRRRSADRRTRSRRAPTPRARSPPCSSGSARSPCSWAASGSPT